jgi:hypothetical protein
LSILVLCGVIIIDGVIDPDVVVGSGGSWVALNHDRFLGPCSLLCGSSCICPFRHRFLHPQISLTPNTTLKLPTWLSCVPTRFLRGIDFLQGSGGFDRVLGEIRVGGPCRNDFESIPCQSLFSPFLFFREKERSLIKGAVTLWVGGEFCYNFQMSIIIHRRDDLIHDYQKKKE